MTKRKINEPRDLALYREAMGDERADRQADLARRTCSKCGGRDGRHHQLCVRRRET